MCTLHGRQCTFLEAAPPRNRATPLVSSERAIPQSEPTYINRDENPSSATLATDLTTAASATPYSHHMAFSANIGLQLDPIMDESSVEQGMFGDLAEQFFGSFEESTANFQFGRTYSASGEEQSAEMLLDGRNISASPVRDRSKPKEVELDTEDDPNPQVLGYSGDMDPHLLQNYRYDSFGAFKFKQLSIQSVCQGSTPTQFLLSQPGLFSSSRQEMGLARSSPEKLRAELEGVVPLDTGRRLIALFRRFILPQYPIFSDDLFPNPESSPPYLLAALYMIAEPFARFDDKLSIELAYESLNSPVLFKLVAEALQYEAHNPGLAVVQTILLVVVRPSANPLILESSLKWSLHGTLIASAQNIGLHHDPSTWNIAPWQVALRRRLSCTIFVVDKWLACSFGRPPLITLDTWLVTALTTADGHMSSLSRELWVQHIEYAALGALLGDILTKLL